VFSRSSGTAPPCGQVVQLQATRLFSYGRHILRDRCPLFIALRCYRLEDGHERFPSFRYATQRNYATQEFLRNMQQECCVLFTQLQTPRRNGACSFLRRSASEQKRLLSFSVTPEANSTNQSCDYVQPMAAALRNGAVRYVKSK